jgi:hypothetical protein
MNTQEILQTSLSLLIPNTLYDSRTLYEKYYKDIVSEVNYFKMISRFIESNFLKSFSKGVFYLPKVGKNGMIPLSPLAIKSLVISSNEYGCEIGEVLYHQLKLTYQKPKTYRYYTSNLIEHKKTYGIATFQRLDVHFDGLTTLHIQFMDVLCNFDKITYINKDQFLILAQSFCNQFNQDIFLLLHKLIGYQKKDIAFLSQVLDYFRVEHTLSTLLSNRSLYKIPLWK